MSLGPLRLLIVGGLEVHGIGHTLGLMPAFGLATSSDWTSRSWLLTGLLGEGPARWFSVAIWLVALVGSLAAVLAFVGVLVPAAWWRPLAVTAAVASVLGLGLFWNAFPGLGNKLGAIGLDLAILLAVRWAHWLGPEVATA